MIAGRKIKNLSTQILMSGVVFTLGFCVLGCGKKERQMPTPQISPSSEGAALPELEQNEIFQTNRTVSPEPPDYTYRETQDGLEPPPPEAAANSAPPVD